MSMPPPKGPAIHFRNHCLTEERLFYSNIFNVERQCQNKTFYINIKRNLKKPDQIIQTPNDPDYLTKSLHI